MANKVDDVELDKMHPDLRERWLKLKEFASGIGFLITTTDVFRTRTEQEALWAQGRTLPGPIVTRAKPGSSKHEALAEDKITPASRALDFCFVYNGKRSFKGPWNTLGWYSVEVLGLRWGGDWDGNPDTLNQRITDRPHLELP